MLGLKKIFKRLVLTACGLICFFSTAISAPKWEPMRANTTMAKTISKDNETEILTMPSLILLNLSQGAKVEVFSILGRLVCEEKLKPGHYELFLETHGVYIIKIGGVTCKVAI